MFDYTKTKTPFYEISIGDSTGKRLVKLPHHILRLVHKVEITEFMEPNNYNSVVITFEEGSREPASPDASLGTKGLYNIATSGGRPDMDIAGSLTNRVGSIADLRFSGTRGITFLTESERKKGKVDNTPQKNIEGKVITRKHKKESSAPQFLFQERNQLKLTWGYIEDPSTVRTIRGFVGLVNVSYPDSGPIVTTITCYNPVIFYDQVTPTKGISFGTRKTTAKGNSIVTFEDKITENLIRELCSKMGIASIVSKNLPAAQIDADKQKLWIAGESFHQFMTKLADLHSCFYTIFLDPKTGKETLSFIKKADFDARLVVKDTRLTTYKAPGTLIKGVEIKVDYGFPAGNQQVGVNQEGDKVARNTDISTDVRQFKAQNGKKEQVAPYDPVNHGNPISGVKGLVDNVMNGKSAGTVDINPSNSTEVLDTMSDSKTEDSTKRIIQLDFTAIGYTKFTPGTIDIRNIGVRYSGKYRLMQVVHSIDSSGYTTRGMAMNALLPTGGITNSEAPTTNDPIQVDVQQFKGKQPRRETPVTPAPNNSSVETEAYLKAIGVN